MPATMGENCLSDRGGDREMKGSGVAVAAAAAET